MITDFFYDKPKYCTKQSYQDRLECARVTAGAFGGSLVVMLLVFAWSVVDIASANTGPGLGALAYVIVAVSAAVIVATVAITTAALLDACDLRRDLEALEAIS